MSIGGIARQSWAMGGVAKLSKLDQAERLQCLGWTVLSDYTVWAGTGLEASADNNNYNINILELLMIL